MNAWDRTRALMRLQTFAIGSQLLMLRAIGPVLARGPDRWLRLGPHVSRWARLGAHSLGITVDAAGPVPPAGALVVANHQGYADVVTIGGLFPTVFAARHDMRRWPMFGMLASAGGTVFINREVKRAGARGVRQVSFALGGGGTVVAFPEGTSTDGRGLLPFRTGIFQAAVEAAAPVVPAAIVYLALGDEPIDDESRSVVGWFQGEPFLGHLLRLAAAPQVRAEVRFGAPIPPPHRDRRALAAAAEAAVRELLGIDALARPERIGREPAPPASRDSGPA